MQEDREKQKIRDVISTWLRATTAGDIDTILTLMAEDVIFLTPGQPPMRGRDVFAAGLRATVDRFRIDGQPDIQEIHIAGNYAFCWHHLSITITPKPAGAPSRLAGHILSVFRKEPDGRWVLFRDSNMVAPV
jgi:uncharacterized protein (TIGR02246 family)